MGKPISSVHILLTAIDETQEKKIAGEKMIQQGPISANLNSKDT